MELAEHIVRFSLYGISMLGNTEAGSVIGLTKEGSQWCDSLGEDDSSAWDIPIECRELAAYMKKNGFLKSDKPEVQEEQRGELIRSAYLHITNRCNFACVGCYSFDTGRNRLRDPSTLQLFRAIDLLAGLGIDRIVFSGGEPFLRDDLAALASRAKKSGIAEVVVATNGTLCTKESLLLLSKSVDTISISFDGTSCSSVPYIRGKQCFDQLVDAIKSVENVGIKAHILPTIHAKNIEDIPAYLDLGKRLGVTVGFSLLSGDANSLGDLMLTESDLSRLSIMMLSAGAMADIDKVFPDAGRSPLHACINCGAGKRGVSIAADGSVYPCHMLHYREFCLGNAFTDSLDAIEDALRTFQLPSVDDLEVCKDCDKRYLCGGGCRARAYLKNGGVGAGDPYCPYYARIIDANVRMLAKSLAGR